MSNCTWLQMYEEVSPLIQEAPLVLTKGAGSLTRPLFPLGSLVLVVVLAVMNQWPSINDLVQAG